MHKAKIYLNWILRILFVIFFVGSAFWIYNAASVRNKEIMEQMKSEKTVVKIQQEPDVQNKAIEKYQFKYSYIINIQGNVKTLTFKLPVPQNENEKQTIKNIYMSPKATRIYNDGVNQIAEFIFNDLNNEKINITMQGEAELQNYNFKTAEKIGKNYDPEKDLSRYLKPEMYIESNDLMIKNIANRIKGSTKEEIIQNIYEYTQKALNYEHIPGISGAKRALNERKGECSEYSAVMVALARAKKIPARIVTGNIAREQNTKHNWVEVYFDKYGWVTFDPTVMAKNVNIYENGKLIRQEKRLEPFAASAKYIISCYNDFSPYYISYSISDNKNGRVNAQEYIQIKKIP